MFSLLLLIPLLFSSAHIYDDSGENDDKFERLFSRSIESNSHYAQQANSTICSDHCMKRLGNLICEPECNSASCFSDGSDCDNSHYYHTCAYAANRRDCVNHCPIYGPQFSVRCSKWFIDQGYHQIVVITLAVHPSRVLYSFIEMEHAVHAASDFTLRAFVMENAYGPAIFGLRQNNASTQMSFQDLENPRSKKMVKLRGLSTVVFRVFFKGGYMIGTDEEMKPAFESLVNGNKSLIRVQTLMGSSQVMEQWKGTVLPTKRAEYTPKL